MRCRKICPICRISSSYISTHLRRVHKVSSTTDLKQMARYGEKDIDGKTVTCPEAYVVPNQLFLLFAVPIKAEEAAVPSSDSSSDSADHEENDPLMEIACMIFYMPITMSELQQLRGPLRNEFKEFVLRKSCSVQIVTLLKTIHNRMKEWLLAVLLYHTIDLLDVLKINSCG